MRFDEVELESVPLGIDEEPPPAAVASGKPSLFKRLLALITDLSLFAALALALSPLLPQPPAWQQVASLAGFVVVLSYYYFVGAWMLWGKSIGGAIFDVRIADGALSLREASMRWAIVILSIAIGAMTLLLIAMR